MFDQKLTDAPLLLTFNDLMLVPGKTEVDPEHIDLTSKATKQLTVHTPLISSPMDTVTESEMAIAVARAGGVGVLHRNCSIEDQVNMAKKVKRAESFIMEDVISVSPDLTIGQAVSLMKQHNISGLPVVNDQNIVIGILTKRDVRFAKSDQLVKDLMSAKVISAKMDITIPEAKELLHKHRIEKLVITDQDQKLLGMVTVKDLERRGMFPYATRTENERLAVGAAIGPFDVKRAKALDPYVDFILIDIAHGHNMNAMRAAAKLSKELNAELVYGSLGSKEAARDTLSTIEDVAALRVGIGSGAICSTSVVTKASSPTVYSTAQVASALHELGAMDVPVIADGGINNPGKGALAFAAGASTLMMGSMFAGCRESPGKLIALEGRMMKSYRGMGSEAAKQVRYALDRYSQPAKSIPEGVEGFVPFRGSAHDVIEEFVSGLKAAFGYAGAANVQEMWTKAKIARITFQGLKEANPHDIVTVGGGSSLPFSA